MAKGWQITFIQGGKVRTFKVAIRDQLEALAAVTKGLPATGVMVVPMTDSEFDKLGIVDGEIIESRRQH